MLTLNALNGLSTQRLTNILLGVNGHETASIHHSNVRTLDTLKVILGVTRGHRMKRARRINGVTGRGLVLNGITMNRSDG